MIRRVALLTWLIVGSLSSCTTAPTPIGKILDQPAEYDGKPVTIAGEVVDSTNVLVLRYYHLADATGRIVVVAKRAVPRRGAQVSVHGTVHQAFSLGEESLMVVVEDKQR